jgi:hypothetical protein
VAIDVPAAAAAAAASTVAFAFLAAGFCDLLRFRDAFVFAVWEALAATV